MSKQGLLAHDFADAALYGCALTHRSAGRDNNERLEFLGDALLNLFVAELVYERHPQANEGDMTRLRAALVNGTALAQMARDENIGEHLRLGPGELKSGGFRRDSILADAFEALVAAVYLDAGWERARAVVRDLFVERVSVGASTPKDAKTRLQELLQGEGLPLPVYDLLAARGDDHARVFDVACRIESMSIETCASGSSRRAAEQLAAEAALALATQRRADGH